MASYRFAVLTRRHKRVALSCASRWLQITRRRYVAPYETQSFIQIPAANAPHVLRPSAVHRDRHRGRDVLRGHDPVVGGVDVMSGRIHVASRARWFAQ